MSEKRKQVPENPQVFRGTAYQYTAFGHLNGVVLGFNVLPFDLISHSLTIRFAAVNVESGQKVGKFAIRDYQDFKIGTENKPGAKLNQYKMRIIDKPVSFFQLWAMAEKHEVLDALATWIKLSAESNGFSLIYPDVATLIKNSMTAIYHPVEIAFKLPPLVGSEPVPALPDAQFPNPTGVPYPDPTTYVISDDDKAKMAKWLVGPDDLLAGDESTEPQSWPTPSGTQEDHDPVGGDLQGDHDDNKPA